MPERYSGHDPALGCGILTLGVLILLAIVAGVVVGTLLNAFVP